MTWSMADLTEVGQPLGRGMLEAVLPGMSSLSSAGLVSVTAFQDNSPIRQSVDQFGQFRRIEA